MKPPVAGGVHAGSPAEAAGLRAGDVLLELGGAPLPTWRALLEQTALHPDRELPVVFERAGERHEASIALGATERYRTGYAGLDPFAPFVVMEALPGGAGEAAGLRPGDKILAVDGEEMLYFPRVQERIAEKRPGDKILLAVERNGERLDVEAVPGAREGDGAGYLGVALALPETFVRKYGFPGVFAESARWMGETTVLFGRTIARLFTGGLSLRAMSGPVDIAKFSGAAARSSPSHFLQFLAFLSLNLGILNFLPIPVLDGGHLFLLSIEGVRRKDLSMAVKERFMQVGFVFLLTLMGVIVALDVIKNVF
jgi:regulator of sigma E protease